MTDLRSDIVINGTRIHNRLVMPPMATAKADAEGHVTKELLDYYDERTRGGYIGLVITEHSYISPEGKASEGQVSVSRDDDVEGLSRLAALIHKNGSRAILQMNHAGGKAKPEVTGCRVFGPSEVIVPRSEVMPEAMTEFIIDRVVEDFASAAARVRAAGFDGVEIHSAHGYLLNQFFSPITNKRTDAYAGSSMEGRLRLHLRVIEAVRKVIGPDFLVAMRLGACDYLDGGITLEDSLSAAPLLEAAGIDMLDISGGLSGYVIPGLTGQGFFRELTGPIRSKVHIPVMLTGGITEPEAADELLRDGCADLIGVGRAIYKDPLWAKHAMER